MAGVWETLDTGTEGNAIGTVGNFVFSAGARYAAAGAFHGAMGQNSAVAANRYAERTFASSLSAASATVYFKIPAGQTTDLTVIRFLNGSTRMVSLTFPNTSYRCRTVDNAGTNGTLSTTTFTADKWYAATMYVATGSTTSNGTIICEIYDAMTEALVERVTNAVGTANAGAGTLYTKVSLGQFASGEISVPSDTYGYDESATGTLFPYRSAALATIKPMNLAANPGLWTIVGGSPTIAAAIADSSDSTYVINPDTTSNESFTVKWETLATGSSITGPVRMGLDTGSAATAYKIEILQGATVIATRTGTVSSETPSDVTVTLSGGEVTAVTDRKELFARITAKAT